MDHSGVGFSPGSFLIGRAHDESRSGQERAAGYLFSAVATEYWKLLKPNVEDFRTRLNSVGEPIAQKFGVAPIVLADGVRAFEAVALRQRGTQMVAASAAVAGAGTISGGAEGKDPNRTRSNVPELPPLQEEFIELSKAEARRNVANALSQMERRPDPQSGSPLDGAERRALRARYLDNVNASIRSSTRALFDVFAEQTWHALRPDSERFSATLPRIAHEVQQTLSCKEYDAVIWATMNKRSILWAEHAHNESDVNDSRCWSEHHDKFATLMHLEHGQQNGGEDRRLHAYGNYAVGVGRFGYWSLTGSTERLRADFARLATNAGISLGSPKDVDPMVFWLHRLFLELIKRDSNHLSGAKRETGGTIMGLVEASVTYCARLERMAAENEHRHKASLIGNSQDGGNREAAQPFTGDLGPDTARLQSLPLSVFWSDRQTEFERYAVRFGSLSARWRAAFGEWVLWWGSTPDGIRIPPECQSLLDAIALRASTQLPSSAVTGDVKPWWRWLNFMRQHGSGFRVTGNTPCTEQEWDAGVKDGRPLHQIRREQKYSTGDEWTKVYRRLKNGKLRRLTARQLEGESTEGLRQYYHWLEDGSIEHVFQASADLCEELAARAFQAEAASAASSEPMAEQKVIESFQGKSRIWALEAFYWRGQKRYECPHRDFDGYELNRTLEHMESEHVHDFYRGEMHFEFHKFLRHGQPIYRCFACSFEDQNPGAVADHHFLIHTQSPAAVSGAAPVEQSAPSKPSAGPEQERADLNPSPRGSPAAPTPAAEDLPEVADTEAAERKRAGETGGNPAMKEPGPPSVTDSNNPEDLAALVSNFLQQCNEVVSVGDKVIRKHIWQSVGHSRARQFQYWQERSDKATDEDDRNFRRVLTMSPAEFISILRKKSILPPRT